MVLHRPPPRQTLPAGGSGGVIQGRFQAGGPRLPVPAALQRRSAAGSEREGPGQQLVPPALLNLGASGQGRPLPDKVRAKMESFFRTDFSQVRIHVGPEAPRIGAHAFTTGSRIYFAPGQFNPDSQHGQALLGHELAHVVQQRSGRVRNPFSEGLAIIQDPQLELEADRLGQQAASHQTAAAPVAPMPKAKPRNPGGSVKTGALQAYFVIAGAQVRQNRPTARFPTYPYALVGTSNLSAQQSDDASDAGFLDNGDNTRANIVAVGAAGTALRVSDDYKMAIEDTNLRNRQPKTFFATAEVLTAANQALRTKNSGISLQQTGNAITIVGRLWEYRLLEVRPLFQNGDPDLLPQNCDSITNKVAPFEDARVGRVAFHVMWKLIGGRWTLDTLTGTAAMRRYAAVRDAPSGWGSNSPWRQGVNEYAAPNVGEAYVIHTMESEEDQKPEENQVMHYTADGRGDERRTLAWGFHYAGVVAQSGKDRITLENYARGDDRKTNPDPRWFFQMYGTKRVEQSFHTANKDKGFANPITLRLHK